MDYNSLTPLDCAASTKTPQLYERQAPKDGVNGLQAINNNNTNNTAAPEHDSYKTEHGKI